MRRRRFELCNGCYSAATAGRRDRNNHAGAPDRGDADAGTAIDDVIDILFGPLIFRRMTGHYALSEAHARQLAATALRGLLSDTA